MKKFFSKIREYLKYNKYIVMVYNFISRNIILKLSIKLNGVEKMLRQNDNVLSVKGVKSRFYVPNFKVDLIQRSIVMNKNYFENDQLRFLAFSWNNGLISQRLQNKSFLDIGANIGNHTLFFMNECKADGAHCFEPVEGTFNVLRRNIAENYLNSKVQLHNVAVGKKEGRASIVNFHQENLGGTCLKSSNEGEIRVISIDDLNLGEDVVFVKIDVEGFELEVIQGMVDFLKKNKPIVFIEIRGCFKEQIDKILFNLGYSIEVIENMPGLDCGNYIYY